MNEYERLMMVKAMDYIIKQVNNLLRYIYERLS